MLALLSASKTKPFDEVRRTGVLRYALIRATDGGEVLESVVASRSDWEEAESVASALTRDHSAVAGVVLNINASPGNVLLGDEDRLLCGRPTTENTEDTEDTWAAKGA